MLGNQIGTDGAKRIGEALETNSALTYLDISDNEIWDAGVRFIGAALRKNSTITALDLGSREL